MGWTITIQLVRDRPLGRAEVAALRAHVKAHSLSKQSEGYGFEVAPAGAPPGVVARGCGMLARSPDPEGDADAATLLTALTQLRGLFADGWEAAEAAVLGAEVAT